MINIILGNNPGLCTYGAHPGYLLEGFTGGWAVQGLHWMRKNMESDPVLVDQEYVTNCSVYDGWWDKKKGKYT